MDMVPVEGLLLTICYIAAVHGYPTGPPVDHVGFRTLCTDMNPEPGHNTGPQFNTPTPYKIKISEDHYTNGKPIQVNITGKSVSEGFAGFLLQARRVNKDIPLGKFSHFSSGTQGLNCDSRNHSAWGHNNNEHKQVASTMWTPPDWNNGEIQFIATIVQGPNIVYWMDVKSPGIMYVGPSRPPTTPSGQDVIQASFWPRFLASLMVILTTYIIGQRGN